MKMSRRLLDLKRFGNGFTSTYSSSLNVSTHPLLSVRETIVTSSTKIRLIEIGIPQELTIHLYRLK